MYIPDGPLEEAARQKNWARTPDAGPLRWGFFILAKILDMILIKVRNKS
jgi:hypothetical protein